MNEVRTESGGQSVTVSQYEGDRLVSQEFTSSATRTPRVKFWNYWTYDQAGKLAEYRRGKGGELQNHELNFQRDGEGRLIGFDYHQGAKDEPFTRTAVRYLNEGQTAEFTYYDAKTGEATRSMTQTVDDRGLVTQVESRERDWETKRPRPPITVTFRYDEKRRLAEQNTSPHEFYGDAVEHELPPGKFSITYDDAKSTKTTEYSSQEGRLVSTLTLDATGATVEASGGSGTENFDLKLDCKYDNHGNWTSCQQVVRGAGVRTVGDTWRRTITYR